jgi:imidazolonepropionase
LQLREKRKPKAFIFMKKIFKNFRMFRQKQNFDMMVEEGRIAAHAPTSIHNKDWNKDLKIEEIDLNGALVLPGFIECHTHSVFAGNRGHEMEMKFQGQSYQQIAAAGGGILSTVKATRQTSLEELKLKTQQRIQNFIHQGVTTLEIKSGYGLDLENEIKMLKAIPQNVPIDIVKTFLGPHAKPSESKTHQEYLEAVIHDFLPRIVQEKLATRADIFIEKGFFEKDEAKKYLLAAQKWGLQITIHADQLSLSGGTELGCQLKAQSVDHCIQVSDSEIQQLAKSSTIAVLLPAADLYLKCSYPPARKMIDAGVKVALATDFNPGTSPTQDLALVGFLARREMGMTLEEVIQAYTTHAAQALGLSHEVGSLEVGKKADFTIWNCEDDELFLEIGGLRPQSVYKSGAQVLNTG